MKNTCPKCDTAYNVTAAAVGRKFTCKNCGTPVVVTGDGLDYQNAPAAPPAPAPVAEAAFDFDAGGDEVEERKPVRAGKPAKPAKRAARDKEPEDEFDDRPARPARGRAAGSGSMGEYLAFRKFVTPFVIRVVFWLLALLIVGGGFMFAALSAMSGGTQGVLAGVGAVFIGVPFYLLMVRIYCELILLMFNIYDRLGDIKTLLEKSNPPPPLS